MPIGVGSRAVRPRKQRAFAAIHNRPLPMEERYVLGQNQSRSGVRVPKEGLEPSRGVASADFESAASAIPPLRLGFGEFLKDSGRLDAHDHESHEGREDR